MQPIHQEIIIAPYDLIFISGAMYLFCFAPSICDFPAINRIFQDLPDQRSVKQRSIAILPLYFANTMIGKIWMPMIIPRKARSLCFGRHPSMIRRVRFSS